MNRDAGKLKPLFDIAPLGAAIEAGATVITPNLRLSRKIRDAWNLDCAARELRAWPSARIMPVDAWLQECWLELVDGAFPPALAGSVAGKMQETLIWERAIAADSERPANARPDNYAELARRGWSLLQQWQVDKNRLAGFDHSGATCLLRWGRTYEKQMADRGLIDSDTRTCIVRQGFKSGAIPRIDRLVLVGFQTLPPLIKSTLDDAAGKLEFFQAPSGAGTRVVFEADDSDNELVSAARWAHQLVEAEPGARIGVVIPRLTALQKSVERIFRHQFQPAHCLPDTDYRPAPFNISAGTALAEAPAVAAALSLLRLLLEPIPVADLCRLLTNPFWGNADSEADIRCRCQIDIRDLGLHELSAGRFRKFLYRLEADEGGTVGVSSLSQRLVQVATLIRGVRGRQAFAQWLSIFVAVLEELGWPGSRTLNSLEYQQLEHWQELGEQFRQLDRVQGPVSLEEAIRWLGRLARDMVFHPQTDDAPVQILGTLEAAGLRFDHLWLMNVDNRQWPEATSPHPLLPIALQRQLAMPRSAPERELELSRALFQLFAGNADDLVLSYARREGDIAIQPSSLLEGIACERRPASADHPWLAAIAGAGQLEIIDDRFGPALPLEQAVIRGGSRLLADQAGCPFNAFAQWRLGAEPLAEPVAGLGPQRRGTLIHHSLELLWRSLASLAGLHALDEIARRQAVNEAVQTAMNALFNHSGELNRSDFGDRLLALEENRLVTLLDQWLATEAERAPFTVASTEQSHTLEIDGLKLTLRLDRVDRLADGGLAIIDYKTGNPKTAARIKALAGERPEEPQLPLYALALDEPPVAVAYGEINRKKPGFSGVAAGDDLLPGCKSLESLGLPDSWPDTLDQWRQELGRLVAEIARGEAAVTFYHRDARNYGGHLEPLNRIAGADDLDTLGKRGTRIGTGGQS